MAFDPCADHILVARVSSPNNTNSVGGGSGSMRPMATGQSAALADGPTFADNGAYFNPGAFTRTPQFMFGNVSRYLPGVNRPTTWNCDLRADKRFRVSESVDLRFRAEYPGQLTAPDPDWFEVGILTVDKSIP